METQAMLQVLRDPKGVPFYPVVFRLLGVLTFALHILCVNLALGALALAVIGRARPSAALDRLAGALPRVSTAAVSAAIVLGVAPLLFVQVLYDPFWYASSGLSAAWAVGFTFVLMAAYGLAYAFMARPSAPLGAVSLGLFILGGFIMHALNVQLLQPERWLGWYAPGGVVDASGTTIHSFSPPRLLHFLIPAVTVSGVFLMAYARYFEGRPDKSGLDETARLGAKLAFWAASAQVFSGFWWLLSLPGELRFIADPWLAAAVLAAFAELSLLGWLYLREPRPQRLAWPAAGALVLTVLLMAAARESLRGGLLGAVGYSALDYPVKVDWASTALFFGTFALGLPVVSWLLAVAWQCGRTSGVWEAGPRMRAWGTICVALLAGWIVLVAGLGVFWTLRGA